MGTQTGEMHPCEIQHCRSRGTQMVRDAIEGMVPGLQMGSGLSAGVWTGTALMREPKL